MTFGVVACIASLVSERGRRLGDVFAGTLVVRERVPAGPARFVPPPPPWLVGRFAGLDLSGVPDGLWLAVRSYLTRMGQLDPQVGWAMAERLAGDLAACTGAPAPRDVPPAAYLAAVVHERQSRDAQRAFGGGAVGVAPVGAGPVSGPGSVGGAGPMYPGVGAPVGQPVGPAVGAAPPLSMSSLRALARTRGRARVSCRLPDAGPPSLRRRSRAGIRGVRARCRGRRAPRRRRGGRPAVLLCSGR